MILTDCHMHTTFSTDGISDMESMIKAAIQKGLKTIGFTEHNDYGAGIFEGCEFVVETDADVKKYRELSEKYKDRIEVLFGVEIGLVENELEYFKSYTQKYPFDFVIGSCHTAGPWDPYYPEYFKRFESEEAAYRYYFQSELERARLFDCYDSYGHLDYALRYGPNKNKGFTYEKYADLLDPLLRTIIEKGKVIEVNSSGYKAGMNGPNPAASIIKRYRKLGGLPLTIGSDAHECGYIACEFEAVAGLLKECGYSSYSIFRKRKREELPL